MDFALQPHLYANVPVIYWPWLFWQLWRIALWGELTGRDVMITVDRAGRVYVTRIGDDPDLWTPSRYPHLHQYYLTKQLPGESRVQCRWRVAAVYAPGSGAQAWIILPKVLGAVVAQVCRAERPTIRDPVAGQNSDCPGLVPGSPSGLPNVNWTRSRVKPGTIGTGRQTAHRTHVLRGSGFVLR